jgi:hypothetical protein
MASAADATGSRGLFVSPRAVDEVHHSAKPGKSLKYDVREPLPATETLAYIAERLARDGWTPVTGSDLPEYEQSSLASGWDEPDRLRPGVGVHLWSARWRDANGNEVVYTLTYICPLEQHSLHSVYGNVSAWYYTREEACRARLESDAAAARVSRRLKGATPTPSPSPCSN